MWISDAQSTRPLTSRWSLLLKPFGQPGNRQGCLKVGRAVDVDGGELGANGRSTSSEVADIDVVCS